MMSINTRATASPVPWEGYFHLLVVYFVWGSTYLAIRVAVQEGSGFPPFMLGASRLLVAGCFLLFVALILRQAFKLSKHDFGILLCSSMFLWLGGNGLVMWAEQHAESGYAALLVATTPMWVALIEAILDRKLPTPLLIGSLLVGFAGLIVLSIPVLEVSTRSDTLSIIALLLASLSWAIGSVWQRRKPITLGPVVSSGYQQLFAGVGFALIATLAGEPIPSPSVEAWWAWWYLLIFGSLLAFTSFIMALKMLPTTIVMTYSYVNPVVAVFLGWLILHENVSIWTIGGTVLVLIGVAGAFKNQRNMNLRAVNRTKPQSLSK